MAENGDSSAFRLLKGRFKFSRKAVAMLVCILLSAIFWTANSLTRIYETGITFPLSYKNRPFQFKIEGELPASAEFIFKESGWNLLAMLLRDLPDSLMVDLGKSTDSTGFISVNTMSLKSQLPGKMIPVRVNPALIRPGVSGQQIKRIPVRLISDLKFRDRFGMNAPISISPDSIDISGPFDKLISTKYISTEALKLQDLHYSEQFRLPLNLKPFDGIEVSNQTVLVDVDIAEFTEGSIAIPIEIRGGLKNQLQLLPSKVTVSFRVAMKNYDQIQSDDFRAFVSAPSSNSKGLLEVKLDLVPEGVSHVRIEPAFVDYLSGP